MNIALQLYEYFNVTIDFTRDWNMQINVFEARYSFA